MTLPRAPSSIGSPVGGERVDGLTFKCPNCGAPLAPSPHAARTVCGHCGHTVDVTPENVARLASVLQNAGVRLAPAPMTQADIHAELTTRAAASDAARRKAILAAGAALAVASIIALVIILAGA